MTMKVDKMINECATARTLNDGRIIGKLSTCDAVAQEIKYHAARLAVLNNLERAYKRDQDTKHESLCTKDAYPIAFSELIRYINEVEDACVENAPLVFKLADVVTLFQSRVVQLDVGLPDVHATRLKDKLLFHIPHYYASMLIAKGEMSCWPTTLMWATAKTSKYSEAIHLAKAAELIRRDMLNNNRPPFTNDFLDGCLQQSVPSSLVAFVGMILNTAQTSSHNFIKGHRNRISPYPSCRSTTALPTTRNEPTPTDIATNVKHTFLCTWLCLSSPRPKKEDLLIRFTRTVSVFHTTECWKDRQR